VKVPSVCGAFWDVGDVRATYILFPLGADTWGNGIITAQRADREFRITWGDWAQDHAYLRPHGDCFARGIYINSTRTAAILRRDGEALVLEFADADGISGWLHIEGVDP
jgi:hypothetical protein